MTEQNLKHPSVVEAPTTDEKLPTSHKVFFFAGMSMEQHSNQPIEVMLKNFFGKDQEAQVKTYTSILSSELLKAQRFEEMATDLEQALESGGKVTILAYSLGAAEFTTALLQMLGNRDKRRKQAGLPYEPLDLANLHLVLRSPAGLVQNITDSWRQLWQVKDIVLSMGKPAFAQMETTINFPPMHQGQSFLDMAWTALHRLYPEVSHQQYFQENYQNVAQAQSLPASNEPGKDFLSDPRFADIIQPLQKIDKELWEVLQQEPPDDGRIRQLFSSRHELLAKAKALEQALSNKDALLTGAEWQKQTIRMSAIAILGLPRILKHAFFGFGNKEIYRWLKSRGAKISLLAPDSEVFTPLETLEEFFDLSDDSTQGKVKVDTIVLEAGTHISMSANTNQLADALRAIQ